MKFLLGGSPAFLFMVLIFWLSSLPGDTLPPPPFLFGDKLEHFLAYSVLGLLLAARRGFTGLGSGEKIFPWTAGGWMAPCVGIGYGIFDEIHQYFVPLRRCDGIDMAADALGVLAGFYLLRLWDAKRRFGAFS